MLASFKRWRRRRIVERTHIPEAGWREVVDGCAFLRPLGPDERQRLRERVALFLHGKSIHGAGGLELTDRMRLQIAAQACLLILNLDIDYYRGWVEVIVYPDEFLPRFEYLDENGVMHVSREPRVGESWLGGPVILSWAEIASPAGGSGVNVVVHEFAHKLDMLNGDANGFPPLHLGMSRRQWADVFTRAYGDLRARLERNEETAIDEYAAESPGEFFAVMSEAFFEAPRTVLRCYPEVYRQLSLFYRQDPAVRFGM